MKYKLLVNSQNSTIVRDFFSSAHEQFKCMSTTEYWEDIYRHYMTYEPHAYVTVFEHKDAQQLALFKKLKEINSEQYVPIVVITDEDGAAFIEAEADNFVDLVITRPINIAGIYQKIYLLVDELEQQRLKRLEEERIRLEKEAEEEAARNARKHIVVVDDDKNILKLLKAALEEKYNVTTMINGRMAERFLESKTCDLILLDYEMPIENGPEVFRELRKRENSKDIPIVFLTGVADTSKIAEVLRLKPQGYLLKPIEMERLFETIDKILKV